MNKRILGYAKKRMLAFSAAALLAMTTAASAQEISLSKKNISLPAVFDEVYQQTGYSVAGAKSLIQNIAPQDIAVNKMPLQQFLEQILSKENLGAKIEGKSIFLYRKQQAAQATTSQAQQPRETITLSGTIKDENGKPVPNATIRLIGTQDLAVSSDNQGFFVFSNIPKNAQVSISSIGHETLTVNLAGDPNKQTKNASVRALNERSRQLTATLTTLDNAIDDVVVTGYMDIDKSRYTGSSLPGKADDI